jgi:hypothetical protein
MNDGRIQYSGGGPPGKRTYCAVSITSKERESARACVFIRSILKKMAYDELVTCLEAAQKHLSRCRSSRVWLVGISESNFLDKDVFGAGSGRLLYII